jgi:hypothetical protein
LVNRPLSSEKPSARWVFFWSKWRNDVYEPHKHLSQINVIDVSRCRKRKNLHYHRDSFIFIGVKYPANLLKINKLNCRAAKCAEACFSPLTLKIAMANCAQFPSFLLVFNPYVDLVTSCDIAALRPVINDSFYCCAEYVGSTLADA